MLRIERDPGSCQEEPNDHRPEAMSVDPIVEDDPTVPIDQGSDTPLQAGKSVTKDSSK